MGTHCLRHSSGKASGDTSNGSGGASSSGTGGSGSTSTRVGTGGDPQTCSAEPVSPRRIFHIGHSLTDRMDETFNNLLEAHTGQLR